MVLDQLGTYLPPYPSSLPDVQIGGTAFAMLYDRDSSGYERRRVVVRDGAKLLRGTVDLHDLLHRFADAGELDLDQSFYMLQLGVEVTAGFGAVRVNHLAVRMSR